MCINKVVLSTKIWWKDFTLMKKKIQQFLYLNIGTILFALGIYFFRMPNSFIVGGASGLSIILSKMLPCLTTGQFVTIINLICILAGLIALGKAFSWRTIYCSMIYSFSILICEKIFAMSTPLTDETLLELISSVILCGVGAGLVIYAGGSTGGIEVLALIVKERTHYTIGNALMFFNLAIALIGAYLFGIRICMFSVLGVLINSIVVEKVIQYFNSEKFLMIVTEKEKELCAYINNELLGSATIIESKGAFKNKANHIVMVVLDPKQASVLKKMLKRIDDKAFAVGMNSYEIIGGRISTK